MVEFRIHRRIIARMMYSKLSALDFKRTDFGLFGIYLLARGLWDKSLK